MLALAYAAIAVGYYVWVTRTALPVASPLGLWVNQEEEDQLAAAA
jgi:hypothetical protein